MNLNVIVDQYVISQVNVENCIIYKATTSNNYSNIEYIDNTSYEFKVRYRNHKCSFLNENKINETALSQFTWFRELNLEYNKELVNPYIKWEVLEQYKSYNKELVQPR